jgi:hypothetical protein
VPEKLSARDVADRKQLRELCKAFGTAMRHTNINHKTKGEDAWEHFADLLFDFARRRNGN